MVLGIVANEIWRDQAGTQRSAVNGIELTLVAMPQLDDSLSSKFTSEEVNVHKRDARSRLFAFSESA